MAFKIGEVAEMIGVKQYVLRYWESEFDSLKPKKSKHNQRMYTKKDVENLFFIRKLLHRDGFSIPGARRILHKLRQQLREEKLESKFQNRQKQSINEALDSAKQIADSLDQLWMRFQKT
ncbi:MAG: MerR family transcriptional regulator [Bdellovibrionales bacterium CG10_big_fil_rev_8_21_14_0_10_45_34]|nr:MAG: MerR family transcriptional regulator [Bdellovibrionales bacterium CG10_big_fil_rev_8_21_14_0_10_45_34]